jgi:hypothetical protein
MSLKSKQVSMLIIILTTSLFFVSRSLNVQAETVPSVKIDPPQTRGLNINDNFTINVTAENCVNVLGVQVDLRFDPDVLSIASILEGPFLSSFGPTTPILNSALQAGQILFADAIATPSIVYASGSGVLFNVTFQVIAAGSSILELKQYPGGGVTTGTYFSDGVIVVFPPKYTEIVPDLFNGFYGTPLLLLADLSKVNAGGDVTFSCQSLGVSGVLNVTLQCSKEGGAWVDVQTKQSNASGFVSFVWPSKEAGDYDFEVYTLIEGVVAYSPTVSVSVEAVSNFMTYVYVGGAVFAILIAVGVFFVYRRRKRAVSEELKELEELKAPT